MCLASNPDDPGKITCTRERTQNWIFLVTSTVIKWRSFCLSRADTKSDSCFFSDWSKAADKYCRARLPPSQTLTLSNHSWIHCHLIIFEEGRDPSRMSGHYVSCPQWGPKIGEAPSYLIMLGEIYPTHPICPTPSAHMLPCFSHASWNCSAVSLFKSAVGLKF